MTEAEAAWAAGLFEGEGSFTNSSNRGRNPVAQLAMTDEAVVRRFHAVVGVGHVGHYDKQRDLVRANGQSCPRKALWQWQAGACADFDHCAELLAPWLGERRKAQLVAVRQRRADAITSGLKSRRSASTQRTTEERREANRLANARYRENNPEAGRLSSARYRKRQRTLAEGVIR
jgi:hypothetical protein